MRVNRRYVNSTRSKWRHRHRGYSQSQGGQYTGTHTDLLLGLFNCLYVFFLRIQRQTLTWLTWPRHPWEESMWEQPAPWLQTFLQWPAATATGWWLHPAVWGKTSPPPPLPSSVSHTSTSLVITLSHTSVFLFLFFFSFSLCLSFFLLFLFPRRATVSTSWVSLLLISRGVHGNKTSDESRKAVLEINFTSGVS